jgi:hypothetical protein
VSGDAVEISDVPIALIATRVAETELPGVTPVIGHVYEVVPDTKLKLQDPELNVIVYPVKADPPSPFDAHDAVIVEESVCEIAIRGAAGTVAGMRYTAVDVFGVSVRLRFVFTQIFTSYAVPFVSPVNVYVDVA